jgi:O-antigen/teichoic acid export membrane protein
MAQVRRASLLASFEQYCRLAVSFLLIAAVSRLLTPAEIGVSALGTAVVSMAVALLEFAASGYLIQRRELRAEHVGTSFTVVLGLTGMIVAGMLALSQILADFYGEPRLVGFLEVSAAALVIEAFAVPINALLRRDMAFGALAVINIATTIVAAVTTLVLALLGFSYMSIAWASFASAAVTTGLSIAVRPDLTVFRPSLKAWREVLSFGGYIVYSIVL